MDDSKYIIFFIAPSPEVANTMFEKMKSIHPHLVLKHRPDPVSPNTYSIQHSTMGTRFYDSDVDEFEEVVRQLGGQPAGGRIFYDDEDFE